MLAGFALARQKQNPSTGDRLEGIPTGKTRVVDLSYAINDKMPAWPGDEHPFVATINASPEKDGYFTRKFCMLEHYGTHLDAPNHFPPGTISVDQIPVERLFGPAVVIDVRALAARDADYLLPASAIGRWEARHGRVPAGAIVLLRTGWSSRWPDAARYRNLDAKGVMHFPGYSTDAVVRLLYRKVSGDRKS